MSDPFEPLGERPRPWLDVEALKERFGRLSKDLHPDRFHAAGEGERAEASRRYADLNTAFQVLRDPRQRLLHLIERETGQRPRDIQRIPPGTMDLFVEVGQTCRDVDEFLARRGAVTSPMLKVKLFREGMEWVERLKALSGRVRQREEALGGELRGMNAAWETAEAEGLSGEARRERLRLGRLEEVYRVLSYVSRWTEQIEERLVRLAAI